MLIAKKIGLIDTTFTFMHLADAFIQNDLHCLSITHSHFIRDLGVASAVLYFFDAVVFPRRKRPVMVKKLFI